MLLIQLLTLAGGLLKAFGSTWDVLNPPGLKAVQGSCLYIPCTFTFPSDVIVSGNIVAIWYQENNYQTTVAYHSSSTEINDRFLGRTQLLGDPNEKNCTLLITNVAKEDAGKYTFRFEIDEVNRWLDKKGVFVTVSDDPEMPEITVPTEVLDGSPVSLSCRTPYFCPDDSISLEWKENIPEGSLITSTLRLDTAAVLNLQNLSTTFSWRHNQKTIQCQVSVGDARAAKEVTLDVKHSPKGTEVIISPNRDNIKQSDRASLACHVNSSNPAVTGYKWFKDGSTKAFSTEQLVSFQSVTRSDYGQYSCEAENAIGTGVAQGTTLTIFSARILVSPSSEILEGQTATLTCDVPGGDPEAIIYSWFKNNIWLKEGAARVLVFHETTSSDSGYYSCKVQNDKGSDTSPPITVSVVYPPRPPVMTSFLETQEGRLAIVHCTVDSEPMAELALQRNGKLVATSSSHGAPNQRLSVTSSRNSLKLEIRGVVMGDEGMYACTATNAYGNSTTSRFFNVESARVFIEPSAEIREGEMVTLSCVATQSKQLWSSYTWFKNTKWMKESTESVLIFQAVESSDAGSYHCKSKNADGSSTSPSRTLTVLYPPRKPLMTSFLEMQAGQLGIIQCSVESDPASEMSLYRRDGLVASTSLPMSHKQKFSVSSSHNSLKLEIHSVALEDEGKYICSANNTYGTANASIDFTAETARITVSPSAGIPEGEMANLTCTLSSDSKVGENYTWYKNSEWFSDSSEQTLMFQQISSQDAGSYYCKVWNKEGRKSSPAIALSVLYAPRNTLIKSFLESREGRLAIIHCTTDSNPPSSLTLYRNDQPVAASDPQTQITTHQRLSVTSSRNALKLEIRGVMVEDEGRYLCSARNAYGTSSQSLYFRVQTARVLVMPSTEIREGDTVTLTCEVASGTQEEVSYVWYKNSRWYREDSGSSLAFQRIRSHDSGYYHCRARDKEGSSTSPSVSVHVSYAPRNLSTTSFLEMHGGQLGIIQCSVDSDPSSEVALYRGSVLVASTSSHNIPDQRHSVSSSYNSLKLEIQNVLLEDEGTYMCLANNTYGNVVAQFNFTTDSARIVVTPSTEVQEGHSVTLTCAVSSNAQGASAYTWYKNGHWHKQGSERTLVLKGVSTQDSASYYCKVQNSKGAKSSSPVSLNVLYPPRNAQIYSFLETGHGQLAMVHCAVDSNPPSELSLLKEGALIANSSAQKDSTRRLDVSSSPNLLTVQIGSVMTDDEGQYTCSATNAYGATSASMYFTVEGARVIMAPGTSLREGDTVTLTCDVTASTRQVNQYIWYKNTKWLLEGIEASLVLQDVKREDAGSYYCATRSKDGSKVSPPVTLQVLHPPRDPLMSSFLDTQRGRLGIIQCSVESDPPSEVTIYREEEMVASSGLLRSQSNQRISVSASHNSLKLEIKDVRLEDQGEYVCSVNNTYGSSTTTIYFTVEAARVLVEPSPELQEGDMLNLTCVTATRGQEKANYTWYKNHRWLQEGTSASLLLHKVVGTDTGSYQCAVEDTEGIRASPLIGINVQYAPRDLQVTSFLETHGKRLGIIQCTVDSAPVSILSLHRNDVLVASTNYPTTWDRRLRIYSSYNSLRLEIINAEVIDAANYACTANNTLGSTAASLYFNVQAAEEVHFYKMAAWVAIVVAASLLLLIALVAGKIWKRKFAFSKLETDDKSIEMTSKREEPEIGVAC
ncbi:sialoadhesin [Ambystoma mexicanum]|uniref:sialoadhesin n=1 Tax=Ambystoma mexicanum TaxID=8296 RepID=UPI0037E7D759